MLPGEPRFFRQRRPLSFNRWAGSKNHGFKSYPNVRPLIALIIGKRFATLYELQTVYSYADALDMAEVIAVNNYNEDLLYRQAQEKAKKGK